MKIRNGFVSNSSSSSFICNFCGEAEGGYDFTLRDADMAECVHGHVFHLYHTTNCIPEEVKAKKLFETHKENLVYTNKQIKDLTDMSKPVPKYLTERVERYEEIFKDYETLDAEDFNEKHCSEIEDLYRYSYPEEYCPVCQKIKEYEADPEYEKFKELKRKFKDLHL